MLKIRKWFSSRDYLWHWSLEDGFEVPAFGYSTTETAAMANAEVALIEWQAEIGEKLAITS